MLPSDIGERAEAAVLATLVEAGKEVVLPFGEQRRYDLAYEESGRPVKVQCKSGSIRKGAVCFRTHSVGRNSVRDYLDDVDLFGVYCHERREVYLVPVADLPPRRGSLRVSPTLNGQRTGIRAAADYVVGSRAPELRETYIDVSRSIPDDEDVVTIQVESPASCCAPLASTRVSETEIEATAQLFKALADPHRVRIVNLLANSDGAVCVCDITDAVGLSQPTVSFHLKKLVGSGLLDREKRGTWAYCSLNRDALERLSAVVRIKGGTR